MPCARHECGSPEHPQRLVERFKRRGYELFFQSCRTDGDTGAALGIAGCRSLQQGRRDYAAGQQTPNHPRQRDRRLRGQDRPRGDDHADRGKRGRGRLQLDDRRRDRFHGARVRIRIQRGRPRLCDPAGRKPGGIRREGGAHRREPARSPRHLAHRAADGAIRAHGTGIHVRTGGAERRKRPLRMVSGRLVRTSLHRKGLHLHAHPTGRLLPAADGDQRGRHGRENGCRARRGRHSGPHRVHPLLLPGRPAGAERIARTDAVPAAAGERRRRAGICMVRERRLTGGRNPTHVRLHAGERGRIRSLLPGDGHGRKPGRTPLAPHHARIVEANHRKNAPGDLLRTRIGTRHHDDGTARVEPGARIPARARTVRQRNGHGRIHRPEELRGGPSLRREPAEKG